MKIVLTTKDTIKIDIELPKSTITHLTSHGDILELNQKLGEHIKQHLFLLHNNAIDAEKDRIEAEKDRIEAERLAAKKRRRFSNFTTDVNTDINADTAIKKSYTDCTQNTFKKAVSLAIVQQLLEKDGLIMNSGLPEVVRFRNSPYAYTVKSHEWSSPFGSTGVSVNDLLIDIAKNIYKMNDLEVLAFVVKYGD